MDAPWFVADNFIARTFRAHFQKYQPKNGDLYAKNNFEIIHLHNVLSNLTSNRAWKLILLVCDNIRTVHMCYSFVPKALNFQTGNKIP